MILDYLKKTVHNLFTTTTNLQGSVISLCMKFHDERSPLKLLKKSLKNT